MSKKLTCSITGDWTYCSDERWSKLVAENGGTDEKMLESYQSRKGKKLVAGYNGDAAKARKAAIADQPKNKIKCTVTGEQCYISDERMGKLAGKEGSSEELVRKTYVSRVASRLRKQKAIANQPGIEEPKSFNDLSKKEQTKIDKEIYQMATDNNLPAPSATKGSKQLESSTPAEAPKTGDSKPATEIKDTAAPAAGKSADSKAGATA